MQKLRSTSRALWICCCILPPTAAVAQTQPDAPDAETDPVVRVVPQSQPEPPARADTVPAGVPTIRWQDLLRRAKSDPPAVLAARAELARAAAENAYAWAQWLPSLTGQASGGYQYDNRLVAPGSPRIDSESLEGRAALNLDWAALDLARGSRIDATTATLAAQGFAFEAAQHKAVAAAAELYLSAEAASALVLDAQLSLERRSQQHKAIVDLVSAGTRSPVDAQRANIEVLSASYALDLRRIEERSAFAALAAAIGLPATALLRPTPADQEGSRFSVHADTVDAARKLALEHRPELHDARERIRASQHEQSAAYDARIPTLGAEANGSVTYVDVRRGLGIEGPQYGAGAGIYLRWRGLDPSVWAQAGVATSEAARASRERDALAQAITAEAVASFYALQRARTDHQRAVALLAAAQVAREAQSGRYLAGLASLLELLDAEDLEQEARQRRIEAQRDEAIRSVLLMVACGLLPG